MLAQPHTINSRHKVHPVYAFLNSPLSSSHILAWIIIAAGIGLRLFHFFYNRSLWTDEAYLSNSLIRMDFIRLATSTLEYEQKAPIGFLWMVKLCVLVFGKKEMALRLFPLLCGIASLVIFKRVAGYFLKPAGVCIALLIVALGPPLVYYAVEVKQYATDVLATLAALYLYIKYHQKRDVFSRVQWGVGGALLIWFSYPAIFILAGMACALCLYNLIGREWQRFFRSLLPFVLWLISFAINYLLFTHKHADSGWLIEWFAELKSFMPMPPTSLKDLTWFITMPLSMLHFSLGLSWLDLNYSYSSLWRGLARMPLLPFVCWAVGVVVLFRQNKKHAMVMVFPFLLAMLASGLRMYPLFERLFIFLAPLLIIFIVSGLQQLMTLLHASRWKYVLPLLLVGGAIGNSLDTLIQPAGFGKHFKNMTGREALLYIKDHFQEGDMVYVYWNFEPIYRYYKEAYELTYNTAEGKDRRPEAQSLQAYTDKLGTDLEDVVQHKRVWLIYNKFRKFTIGDRTNQPAWYYSPDVKPGQVVYEKLATVGRVADTYQTKEVEVILFQLPGQ